MLERIYYYRGFEIGVEPQPVTDCARCRSSGPEWYRCLVRIQKVDSAQVLDLFAIESSRNQPFVDESEAVLQGCYAAERRINLHRAMRAREPHRIDEVC